MLATAMLMRITAGLVAALSLGASADVRQCPDVVEPGPVTLSGAAPVACAPAAAGTAVPAPTVLAVTVSRIENPDRTPFSIAVSLESVRTREGKAAASAPVGTFAVFPPDRTGTYLLNPAPAFARVAGVGILPDRDALRLRYELKPVRDGASLERLLVVLAPPAWRER